MANNSEIGVVFVFGFIFLSLYFVTEISHMRTERRIRNFLKTLPNCRETLKNISWNPLSEELKKSYRKTPRDIKHIYYEMQWTHINTMIKTIEESIGKPFTLGEWLPVTGWIGKEYSHLYDPLITKIKNRRKRDIELHRMDGRYDIRHEGETPSIEIETIINEYSERLHEKIQTKLGFSNEDKRHLIIISLINPGLFLLIEGFFIFGFLFERNLTTLKILWVCIFVGQFITMMIPFFMNQKQGLDSTKAEFIVEFSGIINYIIVFGAALISACVLLEFF
jgi:hypothetical protein